jgi:hypothetical protein
MTPANILAGIPANLLCRRGSPRSQLDAAKALAQWLDARGLRPTLLEIEQERARRASRAA